MDRTTQLITGHWIALTVVIAAFVLVLIWGPEGEMAVATTTFLTGIGTWLGKNISTMVDYYNGGSVSEEPRE